MVRQAHHERLNLRLSRFKLIAEKGIEKGGALLLQRLLVRRFSALPNEVINQIATATSEQIETDDRVLDAATLDGIFRL